MTTTEEKPQTELTNAQAEALLVECPPGKIPVIVKVGEDKDGRPLYQTICKDAIA